MKARQDPAGARFALLSLTAIGVVFGDIGTSPLYALRECFSGPFGVAPTQQNVLGVLSLILWTLILAVTVKYLVLVLRADNQGEGGILALMALVHPEHGPSGGPWGLRRKALVLLGLFGAALLYGDAILTPAISVLSAAEGLEVASPAFEPFVVPLACAVLLGLFIIQRFGTGGVGFLFAPITMVWFLALAYFGIRGILTAPAVLTAASPHYAVAFLAENGRLGFLVLGAVFLVATGGEALYADMGHFGARPIRVTWFAFVLPALLLNYFGQGALLLSSSGAVDNPFYRLIPSSGLYVMVALGTAAAVIASQAVISGAFSLTRQAMQLDYSPRLWVRHTSATEHGQVYLPLVNWTVMAATLWLVLTYQSSSALAAAYGVAVSGTMLITTVIFYVVARELWRWPRRYAFPLLVLLLTMDVAFVAANLTKIGHGGWFPLAVGLLAFTVMTTWRRGQKILARRVEGESLTLSQFLSSAKVHEVRRARGTAVYVTFDPEIVPAVLLRNMSYNRVLHERNVVLAVITEDVPRVAPSRRISVERLGHGFLRLVARYGFMENPQVPDMFDAAKRQGLDVAIHEATFFLGRERILASRRIKGMAVWRERLFAFLVRNARPPAIYYGIPPERIVEWGSHVEI
jgi:KUP system potassium uptake protein